ncbi:MAG: DUF4159 domain-containing protein [Verrucomicrobia bacterium]|nr:DUF4159 domain-containing protein [Verrucomicrobiota bacterium]
MNRRRVILLTALALLVVASVATAQRYRGRNGGTGPIHYTEGGEPVDERTVKTAREIASHSTGTPMWTNGSAFPHDVFTFVRIIYDRNFDSGLSGSSGTWITDFPDSDLNLSFRLQQMTSLKVSPDGRVLRLTDKDLFRYPWIYMVEPGRLLISDEEAAILRKYLLNGGFLMADDFWGELQWENFHNQMKKVFPERDFKDLPIEHPVFHTVFDLQGPVEKLQVPNERMGSRAGETGITWEYHDGEECRPIHVRGLFDDKGRMVVIATHNTDNGDGWEREGENDYFFHNFSEKISFPLGINIIVYAMTH